MLVKLQAGMKVWLIALVALTSLPLFLFASYTVFDLRQAQQELITNQLIQRTEAASNAINERLSSSLGYLNTLATSDAARRNDLHSLYAHARRAIELNPDIRAITLVDKNNKLLFITLKPYGTSGMVAGDLASAKQVFESGKPVVSAPFRSPISEKIVTSLGVPIFQRGKVAYCVRAIFTTDSLNELLAEQQFPADWTSSIVDKHGLILARSRAPELYVGKESSATLMAALHNHTQVIFDSLTNDGIAVKAVLIKVPSWDWSVAVGVSKSSLYAPMSDSLTLLAVVGIVLAALATASAIWLSNFILDNVGRGVSDSIALRRGESLKVTSTPIRELDQLAHSLREVNKREQRTNMALMNVAAQHEQAVSKLESARHDLLTGLPSRDLFLELIENMRAAIETSEEYSLALLFIDLDGFKTVNDSYGHMQGDKVLKQTASILREVTRKSDVAGRMGGDEFVVCISAEKDQIDGTVKGIAERVVNQVSEIGFGIGCSIGIFVCPVRCPDIFCSIRHADQAMYEAKRRGKNCFVVFGAERKIDGSDWTMFRAPDCNVVCAIS